jgi:DNA-binding NarL/FixJ family response regulator
MRDETVPSSVTLARARAAFEQSAWATAFDAFSVLDAADERLEPLDLERFAQSAHMLNRGSDRDRIALRAHQLFLERKDLEGAARSAFWLGFGLVMTGDIARGSGWLIRSERVLDESGIDSVLRGYLLLPGAIRGVGTDAAQSRAMFERALDIGQRFNDRTLIAFSRLGLGRSTIKLERIDEGIGLLDEVMVSVTSGEVSHLVIGEIYCAVIDACHEVFDLRRAHEWTDALSRWCQSQPELAAFQGACRVNRAALLQLNGAWTDALDETRRACEWLTDPPGQPAAGGAFYRTGELNRLRGAFAEAEEAYRVANDCGRDPHPGLALLWLAQRRESAAAGVMHRLLDERQGARNRVPLLEAAVEVMLAVGQIEAARTAAAELGDFAERYGAQYLVATAARARGAVALASNDPRTALDELRVALSSWRELGAPFDAAKTRCLIALASRAIGDDATATIEADAARRALSELGATPEVARIDTLFGKSDERRRSDGRPDLTEREVEVLALIAAGKTNRAIAESLAISEKTVARHVSNIFVKLNLPNRAAATAYAYEHKLTRPAST